MKNFDSLVKFGYYYRFLKNISFFEIFINKSLIKKLISIQLHYEKIMIASKIYLDLHVFSFLHTSLLHVIKLLDI